MGKEVETMDQHRVLIADSSEDFCAGLQNLLRWSCETAVCTAGGQALTMISDWRPDILVLDLMLSQLDGISVLKALDAAGVRPVILATTRFISNYMIETAQNLHVDYLLVKPCDLHATAARIQEHLDKLNATHENDADLQFKISGLLMMMGFSVKLHGFKYLRESITRVLEKPDQSITKELYPDVAQVYNTAGSHVERSIRGAILDAWNRRDDRIWQLYFPADSKGKMAKPTNAVFITRLADGLRISLHSSSQLEFIPAPGNQTSVL